MRDHVKKTTLTSLFLSIIFIVFFALFPFSFWFENTSIFDFFNELTSNTSNLQDLLLNIILFIPFGLFLAKAASQKIIPKKEIFFLVASSSFLISFSLETLQFFMPLRFPTLADIITNTGGALLGYSIFCKRLYLQSSKLQQVFRSGKKYISQGDTFLLPIVYFILLSLIPVFLQDNGNLNIWDTSYPLVLENEYTQDRPWNGSVESLLIWNQTLEALPFQYDTCDLCTKSYESNLFSYFHSTSSCQTSCINPLNNSDRSAGEQASLQNAIPIETDLSLVFPSVTSLNQQIAVSSKFTLFATFESMDDTQVGPARIISLSKGLFVRNLTIAQERSNLIIRMRTQMTGNNGLKPEFIVRGFFRNPGLHKLLVVYDGKTMNVYDNNHLYGTFNLSPSLSFFKHLLPAKIDNIGANNINLLYSSIIAFPLGFLAFLLSKSSKRTTFLLVIFSFALSVLIKIAFFSLVERNFLSLGKLFAFTLAFCLAYCTSSIYLSNNKS